MSSTVEAATEIRPLHVDVPDDASGEQYQAPRSWAERAYPNLIYYNEVDRGGHFAAWEEPEVFSQEIRAAFTSLRDRRRSS
jgi:pimeloyl-ACP methyl ester carboxylesterase